MCSHLYKKKINTEAETADSAAQTSQVQPICGVISAHSIPSKHGGRNSTEDRNGKGLLLLCLLLFPGSLIMKDTFFKVNKKLKISKLFSSSGDPLNK